MADINFALRVLRGIELLPLERITGCAEEWRRDLARVIRELDNRPRIRDDSPLRFDAKGDRLTSGELHRKLDRIIAGWPSWEEEKKYYARKKAYKKNR
jgi:hypothetical protein